MSVLLLSGGLDSAVLLAREVASGRRPLCVGFDYGQRHGRELRSARQVARHYDCPLLEFVLPGGIFGGDALTGAVPVPHAHFEDSSQKATVVANRNMVMLSLAAAVAVEHHESRLLFAAHKGDAAVYPDCRPVFIQAIDFAMQLACSVEVSAPFLGKSKREVVSIGRGLRVPFELTWSCYEGGDEPCEECGACVERREALE
jgi:7-cyano-7-deazaguanine synthase